MKKEKFLNIILNYSNLWKAVLMAFLPLICGAVYCTVQGGSLGQIYLPASEWNDELFYYKQVEGMVKFGYPYGYFGFNESHALKLSFAAWSPVLVLPYVAWGLLFGWNIMSPIFCNLAMMMLGFFFYVLLAKPSWKQLGILTLIYSVVTPITRYTLSAMPEAFCFSILMVYFGLLISYLENDLEQKEGWKLAVLLLLSGTLTLMRPYFILFLLCPIGLWIYRNRKCGIIGSFMVIGVTVTLYAVIKHYLGAEYFTPLFKTEWIEVYFEKGLFAGLRFTIGQLWSMGGEFLRNIIEAFRSGLPQGALFAVFTVFMLLLFWQTFAELRKHCRKEALLNGYLAVCFFGMLLALLLMYKLREGSKHILAFIVVGILALSRMDTKFYKKAMTAGLVSVYLFVSMGKEPYDYQMPFITTELQGEIEEWKVVLEDKMVLQTEQVPSYQNVIIWSFSDSLPEGNVLTKWQVLYALPKGFGISCCYQDYVIEHFKELQSKYISAPIGGSIDKLCQQEKYQELARIGETVIYQRY